ncbi:MAG TPA: tail fiber domain-containing protein, partial [Vicinamibacterales bacterium]
NTIRIGLPGSQTQTFIAGIRGATTGIADAVYVAIDSNGQLGTVSSSRRVKDDIADMAAASSALLRLRPVTFHYKSDQNPAGRTLQYGLIAEEVADIYPGLVARSADGQIETVMYQFLPPMLLNEYQKQQRSLNAHATELARQTARFEATASALKTENDQKTEQIRTLTEQVVELTRAVAALRERQR